MTRIESGVSLYDYTKMIILGELMEIENTIVKRREVEKADRLKMSEVDFIKITVCNYYDLPVKRLSETTRKEDVRKVRQIAEYFVRTCTTLSYPKIAKAFDQDHATIIHSVKSVHNQMLYDNSFRKEIEDIEKCITEN